MITDFSLASAATRVAERICDGMKYQERFLRGEQVWADVASMASGGQIHGRPPPQPLTIAPRSASMMCVSSAIELM
ncbi:hypothetical protein [Alloactinosynnema sp. L-07]|uniref:hypothetical protein n=1 Tax=Alloactinosynnema sp. L-07 TaxID=1653480 RepID=UPI00065EFAC8|nr:hypothetical protein [Alloactinosynnema sp. L-07]CRK56989.1 hypothetical protein [Alloactinosynnema sp. L-07]